MESETWRGARPIVVAGIILILFFFAFTLLITLRHYVAVLFLGVVVGIALNPIVELLEKIRFPRILSVVLVYAIVGGLFSGFVYYAVLEISDAGFEQDIAEIRGEYEEFRAGTILPTVEELEDLLAGFGEQAAQGVIGQALSLANAAISFFTILFTALLFTITQDRMRSAALSFVHPRHRSEVENVLGRLAVGLRAFMRAQILAMVVVGVITYIGLTLLGIRLALVLAFIAFILEIFPLIGPWIAFVPALAVALTHGIWPAIWVSLLYLGIQQLESYVITPVAQGRETHMPALLILFAILIGGALMGVIGALMALPVALIVHKLFIEVLEPWNERRHADEGGRIVLPGQPEAEQAPGNDSP